MKKIIAAALSILVGAFGYTIADKELSSRVDELEASVSSMQEEISSLHETKPTYIIPTTTTTRHDTSTTRPAVALGTEILPRYSSFQGKYMLRCYSDGNVVYIPSQSNGSFSPVYPVPPTQLTYTDTFLYLTEVEAKVSVSENYTEPYSYYDKDYSVLYSHIDKQKNEVVFNFKGNTSPDLYGKKVNFDLTFWQNCDSTIQSVGSTITSDNTIDSNGNFEYTVVYRFDGSIHGFFPDEDVDNGCMKYEITRVTVK